MKDAEKVIIYGNGSMARVLYSYLRHAANVAGFAVDDAYIGKGEKAFCGLPIAPFSGIEKTYPPDQHRMIMAVGFLDMNTLRERKYKEAQSLGYSFTSYVHHSVVRHDGVTFEENCIVLDHVSIHPGCRIGRGTFISSNVNIGHDCDVGDFNWINSGVAVAGGGIVGARCFFGVNSSTAQELRIGKETFIGANTFVGKDTQDGEVYLSESGLRSKLDSRAFLKFSAGMQKRIPGNRTDA
jgi:sugar O-acyltransferase (sialic acid O-acetyltransferase NeuD family)